MRRRKSRVAAARYKAEGARMAESWAHLDAAWREEFRAWWLGPPVHPEAPPRSTLETAQTRGNTGWSTLSTLSTLEKRLGEISGDTPHGTPHAHTWISNIGGPVGPDGPNQQRRGIAAVHPRAGTVDRVDPADWQGEHEPAEPHPSRVACKHCGERINWQADGVAFADDSVAHIRCYEQHEINRQKGRGR
jgi:hypothetical protein